MSALNFDVNNIKPSVNDDLELGYYDPNGNPVWVPREETRTTPALGLLPDLDADGNLVWVREIETIPDDQEAIDNKPPLLPVTLTVVTNSKGSLSKTFTVENGVIVKKPAAQMTAGTCETVKIDFPNLLAGFDFLNANQATCYGIPCQSPAKIVTKDKAHPPHSIARTLDYFSYPAQPGILMLDHDPSDFVPYVAPDVLLGYLSHWLAGCAKLVRSSVSSGVGFAGQERLPAKGYHIYIPVLDAHDIPRAGKALFQRLWLAGHGAIALSRSGAMLERTLIDGAVFSPERLDFTGKPTIHSEALQYNAPQSEYIEGGYLDSSSIKSVDESERQTFLTLVSKAKEEAKPKSLDQQTVYVKKLISEGTPETAARAFVDAVNAGDIIPLAPMHVLHFATLGSVTVADVLNDRSRYDGKALADPVEGVEYGRTTAKFFANHTKGEKKRKPYIHSFAHGEQKYELIEPEKILDETDLVSEIHTSGFIAAIGTMENGDIYTFAYQDTPDQIAMLHRYLVTVFNERNALVRMAGKTRVACFAPNKQYPKQKNITFMDTKQFKQLYESRKIVLKFNDKGKPVQGSYADVWFGSRDQSVYGSVDFCPNGQKIAGELNLWQGFTVQPFDNPELLAPITEHIEKVICCGNADLIAYLYDWLAYSFQYPEKPAGTAIVCRGEKGSGKGTLAQLLINLWGIHSSAISSSKHLVGHFNAHLARTCFLFADEAFYSGDKQGESRLKALITEPTVTIERKGFDVEEQPNYLKILMATNADWAVPASRDERRYCVVDVSSEKIGDRAYFTRLHNAIADPAVLAAFLFKMLARDITAYHSGRIPETTGLLDQRLHSLDSIGRWLVDSLSSGGFVTEKKQESDWYPTMSANTLFDSYVYWCDCQKISEYGRKSKTAMGLYFKKLGFVSVHNRTSRSWELGTHADAIARLENYEKIKIGDHETAKVSIPKVGNVIHWDKPTQLIQASCGNCINWLSNTGECDVNEKRNGLDANTPCNCSDWFLKRA